MSSTGFSNSNNNVGPPGPPGSVVSVTGQFVDNTDPNNPIVNNIKNNPTAGSNPTVTDDSNSGYSIGSQWDTINPPGIYIASDVTPGAAVWHKVAAQSDWNEADATLPSFIKNKPVEQGQIDISYADLLALYNAGGMSIGFYRIIDRADNGIIIEAVTSSSLSLNGTAINLNPDFQIVGNYSGVVDVSGSLPYTTTRGVWYQGIETVKIVYTGLVGIFTIGDNLIALSGANGVIKTDNGVDTLTVQMGFGSPVFVPTDLIADSHGASATASTVSSQILQLGDVVFDNGFHYQFVDQATLNGNPPHANSSPPGYSAFLLLPKNAANVGYVTEADSFKKR